MMKFIKERMIHHLINRILMFFLILMRTLNSKARIVFTRKTTPCHGFSNEFLPRLPFVDTIYSLLIGYLE